MSDITVEIVDEVSSSVSVELSDPLVPIFVGFDENDTTPGPTGPEGKRVQLRNNGTAIQWKYFDAVTWTDLIQNADLIPPGSGVSLPINISDVTGLDNALNGKAPSVHTHTIAEIATLNTVLSQIQTAISNLQSTDSAFSSQLSSNTDAINTEIYDRQQAIIHLQSYVAGVQNSLVNDINALWMHMNAIEAFRDVIDANGDGVVDDSERLGGKPATDYALKKYVDDAISSIVNGSPALLDTLQELATALGNDANFATTMATALAGKEPTITAGTASQYRRGDKTWQTLDKAAVGLGNVDNTADSDKPVSTAQAAAISAKEPTITAPADASKFWDGTKAFRALTTSDIPGLTAAIANRKSFLYYKRSGGWYHNGLNATAFSTIGLTANSPNCTLAFLVIEEVTVITDIAVEVTTAGSAGSVMHFGLFQVTNPLSAYNSGPLIASTTTGIAADSTGVKSLTLAAAVTLQPGVYLATVTTNSTTSLVLRALAQGAMYGMYGNVSVSSAQISSLLGNRASFAALPSNLSSFTSVSTVALTNSFVFWYKVQ